MFKLLIFNSVGYVEYPLEKNIYIQGAKFYQKEEMVFVTEQEKMISIDPGHIYELNNGTKYLYFQEMVKAYEWKNRIWLGEGRDDITVYDFPCRLFIEGNMLHMNHREGENPLVCKNGKLIKESAFLVEEGDILLLQTVRITFFKKGLEVEGNSSAYKSNLLEIKSGNEEFEGFPYYKRSPRVIKRVKEETIQIEKPPQKSTLSKGSLIQMILPPLITASATIGFSLLMGRGSFVFMSAGMTVIAIVFSIQRFFAEKKKNKETNEKRIRIYERYLLNIRKKIRKMRQEEMEALNYQNPSLTEIESMIQNYSSRIYERNALDDDFLTVNLGYRQGTAGTKVTFDYATLEMEKDELAEEAKQIKNAYQYIPRKPVTIDLKKAHLGLVGEKENIQEQIKSLLIQLTFSQSYHDLEIVYIYNENYTEEFKYTRWYPHLRIKAINAMGQINNEQMRDQILGSIHQMIKDRKLKVEENRKETKFIPHFLFIIDEPKLILNHSIMEYLQGEAKGLGFSIIYTTNQKANLPENIHTVSILENSTSGTLLLKEGEMVNRSFIPENTKNIDLERMSRDLGVLIHEKGMVSQIPESITFFDLFQISHPHELQIVKRWEKNESHKSLAVPLGVRAKDDYVELNLHEKAHGPHGLVAGTTGSGKSEIIQSYIVSLAANFHPYEVGFLLIDYKGGGMAGLFQKLPHLLGTITNLDGSESARAMASIKSELARRQRIFNEHGVNHINGYNQLFKLNKAKEPLPHLFIISDEFAELKKEQPEFMTELVSAARIGRSLGIHLILATQKPSGVVDDQIWTNSKFKLCLKVQNEADSKEMLKTPDAANITQAGRSYLQVGNNEIYELFQSAWSGAAYSDEEKGEEVDNRVYFINALGQGEVINQDLSGSEESNQIKATQLDVIVDHIQDVFIAQKLKQVRRPWLPSLAWRMVSPYLLKIADVSQWEQQDFTVNLGVVDIPEEQSQTEYLVDFIKNGHLMYIASSGYGKSVFLGLVIMSLAVKNQVKNLNFYILDLGNSGLVPYKALPHTADYLTIDDNEKLEKFIILIYQEVKVRKMKLASAMAQNFEVYNQRMEEKLKAIVIVVDNFDIIKELDYDTETFFQKISRDGSSLGIYLVISATRSNGIRYSTLNNFKTKIAGFNFEESEMATIVGKSDYKLPEIKGRALVKLENVNMMQIYTPVEFESDVEYSERIRDLVNEIKEACTEERAMGIPVLPEILEYDRLPSYPEYEKSKTRLPIGLGVEELNVQYMDLLEPLQLIIGGSQTGKTNALKHVLHMVREEQIYLLDSSAMELYEYSKLEKTTYISPEESMEGFLELLKKETDNRSTAYKDAKTLSPGLMPKVFYQSLPPIYIVVDVFQELVERLDVYMKSEVAKEIGENAEEPTFESVYIQAMEDVDLILLGALSTGMILVVTSELKVKGFTKFITLIKEAKSGLVLGTFKEQTIFVNTEIRDQNNEIDIGHLHVRGENIKVKLPRANHIIGG